MAEIEDLTLLGPEGEAMLMYVTDGRGYVSRIDFSALLASDPAARKTVDYALAKVRKALLDVKSK